jgi:hypothetical protein
MSKGKYVREVFPQSDEEQSDEARDEAQQHRDAAAEHIDKKHRSERESDTDGFVSQYCHGISAQLEEKKAEIAERGGVWDFPALFDLDGNLVPAKLIDGKFGPCWAMVNGSGNFTGEFISAFPKRESTMEKKGYREGTVELPAYADTWAPWNATGTGGLTQVRIRVCPKGQEPWQLAFERQREREQN